MAAGARDEPLTLADVAAGHVTADRYNAFWAERVASTHAAPCAPPGAGATTVHLDVGATPPVELRPAYEDWAPRLAAARTTHAEHCARP